MDQQEIRGYIETCFNALCNLESALINTPPKISLPTPLPPASLVRINGFRRAYLNDIGGKRRVRKLPKKSCNQYRIQKLMIELIQTYRCMRSRDLCSLFIRRYSDLLVTTSARKTTLRGQMDSTSSYLSNIVSCWPDPPIKRFRVRGASYYSTLEWPEGKIRPLSL
jgi:hypothetical protein